MERELLEVFEEVTKAADAAKSCDGGAEESECLEALERLKNFPVSYQLLVSTQVSLFSSFEFVVTVIVVVGLLWVCCMFDFTQFGF
jgi:hypothetical protein